MYFLIYLYVVVNFLSDLFKAFVGKNDGEETYRTLPTMKESI